MRVLICTQVVDKADPVLSFFHGWLTEFAQRFSHIQVICLEEGAHDLPSNVSVHSLGKEHGRSRIKYAFQFLQYAWVLRREYDIVFVHMNQEYVLLGALLWKALGKRIYLWRNHYAGGLLTNAAVALADKVFCTSRHSYTAQFKKTIIMPVGVDTDVFKPGSERPLHGSILSLGRLAPSKRIEILIDAIDLLKKRGISLQSDIYGDALPKDANYRDDLKRRVRDAGLEREVTFFPGIPNSETPPLYSAHELFVNASGSGMYDKTIFEAAACGALSLASSKDYAEVAGERFTFIDSSDLAGKMEKLLALPESDKEALRTRLRDVVVREHSLAALSTKLFGEMN